MSLETFHFRAVEGNALAPSVPSNSANFILKEPKAPKKNVRFASDVKAKAQHYSKEHENSVVSGYVEGYSSLPLLGSLGGGEKPMQAPKWEEGWAPTEVTSAAAKVLKAKENEATVEKAKAMEKEMTMLRVELKRSKSKEKNLENMLLSAKDAPKNTPIVPRLNLAATPSVQASPMSARERSSDALSNTMTRHLQELLIDGSVQPHGALSARTHREHSQSLPPPISATLKGMAAVYSMGSTLVHTCSTEAQAAPTQRTRYFFPHAESGYLCNQRANRFYAHFDVMSGTEHLAPPEKKAMKEAGLGKEEAEFMKLYYRQYTEFREKISEDAFQGESLNILDMPHGSTTSLQEFCNAISLLKPRSAHTSGGMSPTETLQQRDHDVTRMRKARETELTTMMKQIAQEQETVDKDKAHVSPISAARRSKTDLTSTRCTPAPPNETAEAAKIRLNKDVQRLVIQLEEAEDMMDEYQLAESRLQETSEEQEQTIKEQEEQIEGLDMMMGQMRKARSTLIDKLSKYEGGTIWPGKSHSIELPEDELKAQGGPSPKASPLDEMFGPNGNALDELMTLGALENIAAKALKYLSDTYGIQGALLKICALPLFESAASPIAERADEPSSFRRSSRRMSSMRHLAVLAMQTNRMNAGFPVQLAISNPNHKGGSQTLKALRRSGGGHAGFAGGYLLANTYCAAHHSVATSEKRTVKSMNLAREPQLLPRVLTMAEEPGPGGAQTGLNDRPKAGQFDAEEEEIYPIMPWLDTDAKMSENERVWGTMAFDLTHFGEGECMTWEVDSDDLRVHATNDIKLCVAGISRCVRKVVEEMVGIFEDIQLEEHDSLIQMPTEMRRGTLDLTRAKLERLLNKNVMTCMLDYLRVTQRPSAYLVQLCCALLLEVGQNSLMGLLPFEILNCKTSFIEMEKDTAWEASKLQKGRIQQMTLEGLWDEVCSSMGR
eukprot:gene1297-1883_t